MFCHIYRLLVINVTISFKDVIQLPKKSGMDPKAIGNYIMCIQNGQKIGLLTITTIARTTFVQPLIFI